MSSAAELPGDPPPLTSGGPAVQRSLIEAIGETPLVELRRVSEESQGRIFAKLENVNPGGSSKDRVARRILSDARQCAVLAPFQTIVEGTCAATGVALAQVAAVMRHPFIAVLSEAHAPIFGATMEAYGAELEIVPQARDCAAGVLSAADRALMDERVATIVRETGAFHANALVNSSNYRAHRLGTGPEILRQTSGHFGAFVDCAGTGGTLAGCAAAFKEFDPSIRCFAAEPAGAAVLSGAALENPEHGISGAGFGLIPLPLLDPRLLNGFVTVTADEARAAQRDLASREGILSGLVSGANLVAARKLLDGPCFGESIVIVIHDDGIRHVAADLWRADLGGRHAA